MTATRSESDFAPADVGGEPAGATAVQDDFAYRFEWGLDGLRALAPVCDVIVIVDVLRFSSAVSVAVDTGSIVFPYPSDLDDPASYARDRDAVLAADRQSGRFSLSPTDLAQLPPRSALVLPSPNGSRLAFEARRCDAAFVLAGSLRNASATALRASALANGGAIGVIAAGERWWHGDGPVRPAVEDLLGAGAVVAALDPSASMSSRRSSPEAAAARAAFLDARPLLANAVADSSSGRELTRRGCADDVASSAALDVSDRAAELNGDAFVAA